MMYRARPRRLHSFLVLLIWPTAVFQSSSSSSSSSAVNAFQCSLPTSLTSQQRGQTANNICQFASTLPTRQSTRLYESPSSSSSSTTASESVSSLRDRLGLHDRFDRWRFLQKLLDEETAAADTNQVLYHSLDSYLRFISSSSQQSAEETGSPELTAQRRATMEAILQLGAATGALPVLLNGDENDKSSMDIEDDVVSSSDELVFLLDLLEQILPDPVEDEDAHKGTWDTVIELHGREAVKINEQNATPEWKIRSLVTRVLLYHDFLVHGLVD